MTGPLHPKQHDPAATREKVRANRLRRVAARRGIVLRKSRRRDPRAIDYGTWYLIDAHYNALVGQFESLDQVEDRLASE